MRRGDHLPTGCQFRIRRRLEVAPLATSGRRMSESATLIRTVLCCASDDLVCDAAAET